MERFKIDDIIRDKVNQYSPEESSEASNAKPFIWATVRSNLDNRPGLRWYHLAAAVVLLALSFTFFGVRSERKHQRELEALSAQINDLKNAYQGQINVINEKDAEVYTLRSSLNSLEAQLDQIEESNTVQVRERVVVRRDTVYLKQIEYIQLASLQPQVEEPKAELNNREASKLAQKPEEQTIQKVASTDAVIYPSVTNSQPKTTIEESVKFRFGSFLTSKN